MARKYLKGGALTAPLPPALVSVGDGEEYNLITIGWTGILATVPPTTYISVRPSRYSHRLLEKNGEFVIHLASEELAPAVDYCGIYTGEKVDKFQKCGLTPIPSEHVKCPTVMECPVAIECRVSKVVPMGSHDVFVADIVSVSCREDIVEDGGRMRFDKADLLAYAHGEYYSLGERVGRFGFSTDKPKKQSSKREGGERPFYEGIPKGKQAKKTPTDKNKGAPHGKRKRGDTK